MSHMQILWHEAISYFAGSEDMNGRGQGILFHLPGLCFIFGWWLENTIYTAHFCQVMFSFILEVIWFLQYIIAAIVTEQQNNVRKVQREQPQNEVDTPLKGLKDNKVFLKMAEFFPLSCLICLPLPSRW